MKKCKNCLHFNGRHCTGGTRWTKKSPEHPGCSSFKHRRNKFFRDHCDTITGIVFVLMVAIFIIIGICGIK